MPLVVFCSERRYHRRDAQGVPRTGFLQELRGAADTPFYVFCLPYFRCCTSKCLTPSVCSWRGQIATPADLTMTYLILFTQQCIQVSAVCWRRRRHPISSLCTLQKIFRWCCRRLAFGPRMLRKGTSCCSHSVGRDLLPLLRQHLRASQ